MRVALHGHLRQRRAVPATPGKAVVTLLRAARRRRGLPGGADLLRPADGQHRLPRRGGARRAHLRRRLRAGTTPSSRRRARAPDRRGTSTRIVARALRGRRAAARGRGRSSPRVYELTEFLVDVLGVTDVGAYFPHTRHLPPDLPLAADARGGRPAAAAARARSRGLTLVELPGAEECCGFGGTFAVKNADTSVAMGSDKARHVRDDRRRGAGRRRQLLPDAHRRHCSSRQRAGVRADAPRRDPGRHRGDAAAVMTATFVGMPAVPRGGARRRSRDTQLRAQPRATPPHTIRDKRAAGRRRGRRTGRSCALAGAAIKDAHAAPTSTQLPACSSRRRSPRPAATVHWAARRRRGQPDRRRPREGARRRRGRQGQVDGHPGDRAQRGARPPRASPPGRPTSPS